MKIIYNVYGGDSLNAEGMFDENGNLIDAWSQDDAKWREEYFNGFMKELGIIVKSRIATKKDIELIKKYFGF